MINNYKVDDQFLTLYVGIILSKDDALRDCGNRGTENTPINGAQHAKQANN